MSFIYPRVITITRQATAAAVGTQPYSSLQKSSEIVIAANVPASIQLDRLGKAPLGGMPAGVEGRGTWRIFFKLPVGTTTEGDVATDDLGDRYKITNAYWNSLGYAVLAEKLKTG